MTKQELINSEKDSIIGILQAFSSGTANIEEAADFILSQIFSKLNEYKTKEVQDAVLKVDKFEILEKAFDYLLEDCRGVTFVGVVDRDKIPDTAELEENDGEFDHEYNATKSDGFDEASFWGDIYLPIVGTEYMRFDVHA